MEKKTTFLEGIISVEAAIRAKSRKIHRVYIDKKKAARRDRKITGFLSLLKAEGLRAEFCDREALDAYADSLGNSHGGVIAVTGERGYLPVGELLQKIRRRQGYAVLLDGVEDPYNLGYSIRSLYAAGAGGVILPKRDWSSASNICAKASAGASELIPLSIMPEIEGRAFGALLAEMKIGIVCAAKTASSISIFEYAPSFPFVLFIGGEKRGISPAFMEAADAVVHIPYAQNARYSLPVVSVAAVLGFELMNKQGKH